MRQLATGPTPNWGNCNRKKDRTMVRFSSVHRFFAVLWTEPLNTSPACHCALKVKLAAGSNFPGQYYIWCHAHHYHYTFMPGVAPNAISAPTSHSSTTTFIHTVAMFMRSVEASTREAKLARAQELADEAKEEADYQAALAASLSHSPPHNNTHSSPSDFASTSHITSSHFASSSCITSSSHVASSSRVASSRSGPLSLVRFTPSPPAPPPSTSTKAPKHTIHLRSEWMRGYEDKTSQLLKKRGQAQGDMALLHKFFIMFWRQDGAPPEVLSVQVLQGWPTWTLAQCPKTLEKLGTEVLDVYNIPSRHWVQVDASWPHSVSTNTHLLFRCRNVKCLDFDKELATIMRKNTHLRTNMPGDRSSV
ncbi:uncharacterized protein LACBIDRAFT_334612 [Laccaria bicolor S238N-H82]|uniref:Predicted protein n=1 Tax=Laccaria bicolor (strain S238N-H82 / ATCC MYA-4686) TaxID=486041 RepID=B0DZQ4_LACBS|nr:uncharacterized protein LACBIDRAFT_334610 [Laccaria bicolor S238N-H82]XP_001889462.1 uncharacterized protein LACBIDRAFT_334612 [Laccaria bicolor S238N-H82]EDQ99918.1 predicted protein [Laccaria bicolor S238N-H82]EDQ99919.1 predicted protein [Laccaria bicolor S238N-H82]|eukprot:XP_001889461.1 predicted protein [Laccaria bicolor S238N-H82]